MEKQKNVTSVISIIVILILLVIVGIVLFQNLNKEDVPASNINTASDSLSEEQNVETENRLENITGNIVQEELDVSIDEQEETIIVEGQEEIITTKKYVSSLGYSMRYSPDICSVSKENGKDVFKTEEDNCGLSVEVKDLTYEKQNLSTLYEEITINGETIKVYPEEKVENSLHTVYTIQSGNDVLVLTIYHPDDSGYLEGWGTRAYKMIESFEINE